LLFSLFSFGLKKCRRFFCLYYTNSQNGILFSVSSPILNCPISDSSMSVFVIVYVQTDIHLFIVLWLFQSSQSYREAVYWLSHDHLTADDGWGESRVTRYTSTVI
jgi:hypothetical protein